MSDRVSMNSQRSSYHGGAFFDAIGREFDSLERINDVISADVLDAWFPPSPAVIDVLQEHLSWAVGTSPPTESEGLTSRIARTRGVARESVIAGAGSSSLIFLALRHWLTRESRALVLDPSYGEYAHVLENVVGCSVDRLVLSRADGYRVDLDRLERRLRGGYDLVVIVNPNNPTGRHIPRQELEGVIRRASPETLFWIDETYVDYVDKSESIERFASESENVVVCKSMSKVYALSGLRVGYLCGPPSMIGPLSLFNPPWSVSLPGQLAAVCRSARPGLLLPALQGDSRPTNAAGRRSAGPGRPGDHPRRGQLSSLPASRRRTHCPEGDRSVPEGQSVPAGRVCNVRQPWALVGADSGQGRDHQPADGRDSGPRPERGVWLRA